MRKKSTFSSIASKDGTKAGTLTSLSASVETNSAEVFGISARSQIMGCLSEQILKYVELYCGIQEEATYKWKQLKIPSQRYCV